MKTPRVHRMIKNGRLYKWHRKTRAPLPCDVPESHPDFITAWMIEEGRTPRQSSGAGSFVDVWRMFKSTTKFKSFGKVYRATITRNAEAAVELYGPNRISRLEARHIHKDLEQLDPHAANARLKMWRLLCRYAVEKGLAETCVADAVKKPKAPPAQKHAPWDADEVARYRAVHQIGTPNRLCFELLYWTGARTNDAVRLCASMVTDSGLLKLRQSKTGGDAFIPWTSALPAWAVWENDRAILHQCIALNRGFTFLEVAGRSRSVKGLSNLISQSARRAGIAKTAHGLRATRLTLIAEAGGSTQAIMAWGGHKSLSEAEGYTREADRQKVLVGAATKLREVK